MGDEKRKRQNREGSAFVDDDARTHPVNVKTRGCIKKGPKFSLRALLGNLGTYAGLTGIRFELAGFHLEAN